jgi:hypothetical protein
MVLETGTKAMFCIQTSFVPGVPLPPPLPYGAVLLSDLHPDIMRKADTIRNTRDDLMRFIFFSIVELPLIY